MNVLYLSPQFPPNFRKFCSALKAEGATVFGIGDTPPHEIGDDLHAVLTEYIYIPELFHRYDDLRNAVAGLIHRHGKIDRLDSQNEHWLDHEARLRDDFDVFGMRTQELRHKRSKLGMKESFARAGVPMAPAEKVISAEQSKAFAEKFGLPVVLKPDVGVGAFGARRIDTLEELDAALNPLPDGMLIEPFIRGRIITFDGLNDRDGRILYCTSHVYSDGIMEIVTNQLTFHYYSVRHIPPALEDAGRRIVSAFDIRERFFHIEFFEVSHNEYWALEVNLRPPGGYTMDMMNLSTGQDFYRAWAKLLVTGHTGIAPTLDNYVAHVGRRDRYRYALSDAEFRANPGVAILQTPEMPPLWRPVMGDHAYLLADPDHDNLIGAVHRLEKVVHE